MPVIAPATSEVNLTPTSTELESFADDTTGAAVLAQMLYGPPSGSAVVNDQVTGPVIVWPAAPVAPLTVAV